MSDLIALREDEDFRRLLTFFRRDIDPTGCRLNLLAWLYRDHSFLAGWSAEIVDVVTALPDGTADLSLPATARDLLLLVDRIATKQHVIIEADSFVYRSIKNLTSPAFNADTVAFVVMLDQVGADLQNEHVRNLVMALRSDYGETLKLKDLMEGYIGEA